MDLAYLLPALACGAMMVGCVVMMSRTHRGRGRGGAADSEEVARLREEVGRLRADRDEHSRDRP